MPSGKLSQDLGRLDPAGPRYATDVVEQVLAQARAAEASDVHLHPGADGLEVRWRIDGVLQPVAVLPSRLAASVVARLKVLAELLTYRTDVPRRGESGELPARSRCGSPRFPRCMARMPWCVCSQGRAGSSALPIPA
ncbi:MAG TPA: ATPase, T2SS/T4P/T4SS family [Isosphaeraceae bacterium]|nr:ATPase, T2SS/T4P/T4SS family [Isosphaeraceae bacterium]